MPGLPLSLPEREEIAVALIENRSVRWAEISRRIARHPTTVAREVEANGGRGRYRPASADQAAASSRLRQRLRQLAPQRQSGSSRQSYLASEVLAHFA